MKILNIKAEVERLLEIKPHLRDDDNKLIANVWFKEAKKLKESGFKCDTDMDLLYLFSEGKLTPPESITRCRRKLQEVNEGLRGDRYKERQEAEEKVKAELKLFEVTG